MKKWYFLLGLTVGSGLTFGAVVAQGKYKAMKQSSVNGFDGAFNLAEPITPQTRWANEDTLGTPTAAIAGIINDSAIIKGKTYCTTVNGSRVVVCHTLRCGIVGIMEFGHGKDRFYLAVGSPAALSVKISNVAVLTGKVKTEFLSDVTDPTSYIWANTEIDPLPDEDDRSEVMARIMQHFRDQGLGGGEEDLTQLDLDFAKAVDVELDKRNTQE